MQPTKKLRLLLAVSGLMAIAIGASILFTPESFHASYGTELGSNVSLLSEVRAPGGALLALGLLIGAGAFVPALASTSAGVSAVVYLAYGVSRLVGLALDGVPDSGLVTATGIELLVGTVCAVAWLRGRERSETRELRGVREVAAGSGAYGRSV